MITIFYSYSHRDEEFREELEAHLAVLKKEGLIDTWNDRRISPGNTWEEEIDLNLDKADIILLLVSSNFLASDYCYETETIRALEKEEQEESKVIPIILKPCLWKESHFKHLNCLPEKGRPITTWANRDEAWLNVAEGILNVVKPIKEKESKSQTILEAVTKFNDKLDSKSLKQIIVDFLKEYNKWYFSPLRINKWGSRQKNFENLAVYSSKEIKDILSELEKERIVKSKISQIGNPIYKLVQ